MPVGSNKAVSVKTIKEKTEQKLDVVLDIQSIIAKNKGPGYEQWAKRHNIIKIEKTNAIGLFVKKVAMVELMHIRI